MKDALKRGFFGFICCLPPTWWLTHDLLLALLIDAGVSVWMILCWWGLNWFTKTIWLPERKIMSYPFPLKNRIDRMSRSDN